MNYYCRVYIEILDKIPSRIRIRAEQKVRIDRSFRQRQAERACATETRIRLTTEQLTKNLAPRPLPPTVAPKRYRSVLPVRKNVVIENPIQISDLDKLFYRAFSEDHQMVPLYHSEDDHAVLRSLQSNCIPFYFDFFLKQHDYFPIYDFKTEIELTEGPESKHFHYEDVLDDVNQSLDVWERNRQKQIEKHVRQTWHLYNSANHGEEESAA